MRHLLQHHERVVARDELFEAVWPGVAVSEDSLATAIAQVRKALGHNNGSEGPIQTYRGRGYRLVTEVREAQPQPPRSRALGDAPIRSIAVLPLQNLSSDSEQEYFADGVTEDLIGALVELRAVRVPSHRSVLRFKSSMETLAEIARTLGVDAVLEGTVRRDGDRVRITVQLVWGEADEHRWHQSYDEDLRDILALQARIARSVAERVRVTVASPGSDRRVDQREPVVPAAYDAYLRALQHERVHHGWASTESIEHLEEAVALDPEFAAAQSLLGISYYASAAFGLAPPWELMPKARAAAERAIELGGSGAVALLGFIAFYFDWAFEDAWSHWEETLRAVPGTDASANARSGQGSLLCARGERSDGLRAAQESVTHSYHPFYVQRWAEWARVDAICRKYDAAIARAQEILRVEPEAAKARLVLYPAHG